MSDVAAAIRAKLDSMVEDPGKSYASCAGCEGDCYCQAWIDYQNALVAVLELWQDPEAIAARPLPDGEVAQAMWHYDVGRAAGINEALLAVAKALGIQEG